MVETISKRRTHYEVLGLTPAATSQDIEQAFARAFGCFRPHTVGGLADLTVAYQALRNPAKRRAYDRSLGLEPEKSPQPSPGLWRIGGQVMTATPVMRPPAVRPAVPEPQVEARADPVPPATPEATPQVPFIAAALRDLASQEPLRERLEALSRPQEKPPAKPEIEPGGMPQASDDRRVHLSLEADADKPEAAPIPWQRAGIIVGGLTAVVALLGAWAGWESVSGAEPVENGAQAVLPPPTTYTVSDAAAGTPDPALDAPVAAPVRRSDQVSARAAPARPRPTPRIADIGQHLSDAPAAPAETAAVASAPAEAPAIVSASLPLPNRVIARTIERIGYPCGAVASATAGAAPGVFKVTCTSGHSYQAAPVRGRYHFRRVAGG